MDTPLEHPNTVIFEKNKYYRKPITEEMIYRYYNSVAPSIVEELNGDNLMLVIRADGDVIKKHLSDGMTTVRTPEELSKFNSGRVIEFHRIFKDKEPFAVVDVDPREDVDFEKTKEITEDLTKELEKLGVKNIQVYFSGNRGFHIYAYFDKPRPVNDTKEKLKKILNEYIEKKGDPKIMLGIPKHKDEIRLDITIFHPGGSIRLPYSLHKSTGLAAVPVKNIRTFTPEQAKITKFIKLGFVIINDKITDSDAIGFDFDNTIFKPTLEDPYRGTINEKVVELMRKAKISGYKVIIFTSRIIEHPEDIEFIMDICNDYDIPYDEITCVKDPSIEAFIDDKAVNVDDLSSISFPNQIKAKLKTKGKPPAGVSEKQFPRETKNYLRYRQFSPSKCKPGSFWVKSLKNGDKLVMCELKDSGKTAVQSKMKKKKRS